MTTKPVAGDINAAVLSERLRVSAILESAEGKRNPAMATELALRTSLDVDTARGLLAKAPAANPYLAALDRETVVNMSAATADFSAPDPKAARLQEIRENVASFNSARGYTKPSKG
ncbi:hypothetical protein [Bradyrhizobium sp.]|uniref:hypothetical protein n=1 Tax=Bradyrhizobium sp. TaxID=376 RepID=UPI0025B9CA87|nr:hypothetical protein [Bradyrhizobium sp.]